MKPFVYMLQSAPGNKKIKSEIDNLGRYSLDFIKGETKKVTLVDTFDMELLKGGKLLFQWSDALFLVDLKSGRRYEQEFSKPWSFSSDLNTGPIKNLLASASTLRAYLPVDEIKLRIDDGRLLDDEMKTRARLTQYILSSNKRTVAVGTLLPMRGYDRAYFDLKNVLRSVGATKVKDGVELLLPLGTETVQYVSKPKLDLKPSWSAGRTAVTIIGTHIKVARQNELGVINDFDTEFLHDYRVNFRKIRSLLSLFKGIYSEEETSNLKIVFSSIMQTTNRLRDLDVYLLEKQNYFEMVPATSRDGLKSLFGHFERERSLAHQEVNQKLKSKKYSKRIAMLQRLFEDESNLSTGPKNQEPALKYGCELINKKYKQVCKIARKIDASTPDDTVHDLRIICKKLRYLMEFFTPLFQADRVKELITALKRLQDNLGLFNDYSVQQLFLQQVLVEDNPEFKKNKTAVIESIGALTAMLYQLQVKERNRVMESFRAFDSEETRNSFKKLFDTSEGDR